MNNSGFLIRHDRSQEEVVQYFWSTERKEEQLRIIYLRKSPFSNEEDIKTFSEKGKLREFVANRPIIKRITKNIKETIKKES